MRSRLCPPNSWQIGAPIAWPKMSHSAMSITDAARISALLLEKPEVTVQQLAAVLLNGERILAEQVGCCQIMDLGFYRGGAA